MFSKSQIIIDKGRMDEDRLAQAIIRFFRDKKQLAVSSRKNSKGDIFIKAETYAEESIKSLRKMIGLDRPIIVEISREDYKSVKISVDIGKFREVSSDSVESLAAEIEETPFVFISASIGSLQMRKIAGEIISIAMEEVADCLTSN